MREFASEFLNDCTPFSEGGALPAAFEHAALLHRDRPALGGCWGPTYGELNAAANRMAHAILRLGCELDDRVAILMQHDTPAIAAVLAVLKAGKIATVFNPTHPPARLRQLTEDVEPALIISDMDHLGLASEIAGSACTVVAFEEESAHGPDHNPLLLIHADQTACIVYTSGSTGRPKGVMKTHRQLVHSAYVQANAMRYTAEDRIPLLGSLSSGQGITWMWGALLNGAQLCPFPMIRVGTVGLRDWLIDQQISVYMSSASVFRNFAKTLEDGATFPLVHAVRLASEAATSEDFKLFKKYFSPQCTFVHTLSSSETSIVAVWRSSARDDVPEGRLPVGEGAPGTQILMLNELGQPVAPGEIGQIVVASCYMAAGYWRQPSLTAERFTGDLGGLRQFRTGDMGRINPSGQLEFAGRTDARVKIRGNRIELSEVESALHRLPGVKQAVVDAIKRENKEPLLVGYIVTDGHFWSHARLRTELRSLLPDYMVPSVFLLLENLPLTSSGKIDREKLREIYRSLRRSKSMTPMTATEVLIAKIWAGALDVPEIGRDDDFFKLGGDSLIATVVSARLYTLLKIEIDLAAFANYPTLAAFARFVDDGAKQPAADLPAITPASRAVPPPLSSFQEHWWQTETEGACQTMACPYRISGALDVEVLRDCMRYLARRHEVLRTSFELVDGVPIQVIHPSAEVQLPYIDLSARPDAETQAQLLFKEEAARGFDLFVPPLVCHRLIRVAENEYLLLRTNHHIIADSPSWNIYYKELAQLYDAKVRGVNPPLPETAPLQYADYVNWQRAVLLENSKHYQQQIAWWKDLFLQEPRPLELPFQRAEPVANLNPNEGRIWWGVPPDVSQRLNELGQKESATCHAVRLAAFAALLAAETGQRDLVIGSWLNSRRHEATQEMLGLFTNPVTVILNCDLTDTFRKWLSVVRQQFLAVQAHADLPYELLRREMHKQNVVMPEIRAILAARTLYRGPLRFGGVEMVPLEEPLVKMPSGFVIAFAERDEAQHCLAQFDARRYDPAGVRHLIARFKYLVDAVSRKPDVPINELLGLSIDQLRERDKVERRIRALRAQLQESEADRAARLEQINILTNTLKDSEADRLERINILTNRLKESEADRAARLEQIDILTDTLKESRSRSGGST